MDKSVNISGEKTEVDVKAKMSGNYVMISPGATNKEVADAIGVTSYKVTNSNKKEVSETAKAINGNTFTNTKHNTSYLMIVLADVNGDGQIKATDYAKIKNYIMDEGTLTDMQKKAADVNGDGQIKATDYAKIKNYIMNSTPISVKEEKANSNTTMSYADIIIKAAEESGISPYSIAIKIIQEVGRKGSNSVSGTYPGYEGYYNFYNFGAYDTGNAIENGLKYAKEKGWNSQYKSIVEGAKLMADSYISVGQNTAYLYKFDVVDGQNGTFWHQYMTNVQDPSSQAKTLYNTYAKNELLDLSLNFIIPVFNDMPNACNLPGTIDKSLPTSYYVNGTGVNLRSSATVNSSSVGTLTLNEVVTVEQFEVKEADRIYLGKDKES